MMSIVSAFFGFEKFIAKMPECNDGIDNDENGHIDFSGGCDFNNNGILDEQPYSSLNTGTTYFEREMSEEECVIQKGYKNFELKKESILNKIKNNLKMKLSGFVIFNQLGRQNNQIESNLKNLPKWYPPDPGCLSEDDLIENHCIDGVYNGGEEWLDCGWTCPNECDFVEKSGRLEQDETWSGNIYVSHVEVPEGITLTIEPSTVVKFKYDRDYKTFDRGGLETYGGTIIAQGTQNEAIWFTSSAEDPINGDWGRIYVSDNFNSIFDYVIVEYGEMGIVQYDSSVSVTNSIIRWANAEGLYAERSNPYFENNLLYSNGYHEIALEQYNENVNIINNIFTDGIGGVHNEKTESYIQGNCFKDYFRHAISGGMESSLEVRENHFLDILEEPIEVDDGVIINEDYFDVNYFDDSEDSFMCPELDFEDLKNFDLGYNPGSEEDRFAYIYDEVDETRRIVQKIGEDLSFGWTLEYVDEYLYRFSLGHGEVGDSLDFIRIDPENGNYERFGNDEIMNPRGLTYDGEYFYVNDFSLLKIFKFRLEEGEDWITIYDSFDIPDVDLGGTKGLTNDGDYLYLRSRDEEFLYKMQKNGEIISELYIPGSFTVWTGNYFWAIGGCDKGICKYNYNGDLVGEIYPPAKDPWGITWDGEYLWTIQRTCEIWNDPKIYKIEILDDSLG